MKIIKEVTVHSLVRININTQKIFDIHIVIQESFTHLIETIKYKNFVHAKAIRKNDKRNRK